MDNDVYTPVQWDMRDMRTQKKKRPTLCYCLKIRRATGAVTRFYDQILAPAGVTICQYSVLLNIFRSEHCSVRELADIAELDGSTLTRNLKPLFRQGLVQDTKLPGMRNSRLELTNEGKKTLEMARPLWQASQDMLVQKLFPDVNTSVLDRVLEALNEV
jgi:DNA-binding MarR family transcriptional regulator